MKYLAAPIGRPSSTSPQHPTCSRAGPSTSQASLHDTLDEPSRRPAIINMRDAINALGIDFMPDLVKFFTGQDIGQRWQPIDPKRVKLDRHHAVTQFLPDGERDGRRAARWPRSSVRSTSRTRPRCSPTCRLGCLPVAT